MHTYAAVLAATALCLALPARAEATPSVADSPRAANLELPPSTARAALMMVTEGVALAGVGAASYLVGSSWAIAEFNATGRPDPQVIAGSIALSLAINLAITWLVLPELARITDDEKGAVDVGAVRREAWRTSRWVALACLGFVSLFAVGAVREHAEFGKGQGMMLIGIAGSAASVLTFDLTALFATRQALNANRHPREEE